MRGGTSQAPQQSEPSVSSTPAPMPVVKLAPERSFGEHEIILVSVVVFGLLLLAALTWLTLATANY